jgi:hypothetical protein
MAARKTYKQLRPMLLFLFGDFVKNIEYVKQKGGSFQNS